MTSLISYFLSQNTISTLLSPENRTHYCFFSWFSARGRVQNDSVGREGRRPGQAFGLPVHREVLLKLSKPCQRVPGGLRQLRICRYKCSRLQTHFIQWCPCNSEPSDYLLLPCLILRDNFPVNALNILKLFVFLIETKLKLSNWIYQKLNLSWAVYFNSI